MSHKKNKSINLAPIIVLSVIWLCSLSHAEQLQSNVLLLMIDDLRPAIGAYGDERAITPNIDTLAEQGVLFKRAYTNVPVCGASRASMMTSIQPTPTRFVNYFATAEKDAPNAISIPQAFKQAGYHTISNGKIFHNSKDLNKESWTELAWNPNIKHATPLNPDSMKYSKPHKKFDARGPWYEIADAEDEAYFDGQVKNKTISDLQRMAKSGTPFFIASGFIRPHLPFYAPKKYYDLYDPDIFQPSYLRKPPYDAPKSLSGSKEIRTWHLKNEIFNSDAFHKKTLLAYYASVSYVDQLVGDILKSLKDLNLHNNTIVVLVSDHGFNLGEHNFWGKHNLLNTALNIPMIIKSPNSAKGELSHALVDLLDLFPTLLDLSNIEVEETLTKQIQGKSFAHLLSKPNAEHKPYVYSRYRIGDSIITQNLLYTEYTKKNKPREYMLFDLKNDPNETVNVVNHKAYENDVTFLRAQLTRIRTRH